MERINKKTGHADPRQYERKKDTDYDDSYITYTHTVYIQQ